ncbi:hypothetical protein CVV43_02015 [Candidatus Saccharibacteria bacterium HGW-Saccharibacteria-1]|jgi:prepilin-type N-terminal cleavage/methylation domain-containing protein|nr:MAG: hypothetical protein CVV43_02015 [Candidatus Saccharibacteria bacterium HGW-Saccharibacteria-1]
MRKEETEVHKKSFMKLKIGIRQSGFTIVELLVVIVVIGILAAITIVSYVGISAKANDATIQSDSTNASKKLKLYYVEHDAYPSSLDSNGCPVPTDNNYCIKLTPGSSFSYNSESPYQTFTIEVTKLAKTYRTTDKLQPVAVTPAASFATAWGNNDDEYGNGVAQTNDGGYVVTGRNTAYDAYIAKYSSEGNLSWVKTWGGVSTDHGYGIVQTSDGGYAITGYTYSFTAGNSDMFLARFDVSGNVLWSKTWGSASADIGNSLSQTGDGGFVVTGYTGLGSGGNDMFINKYDSSGNLSWHNIWGGASGESGQNVIQASDGSYLVTGETYSYGAGGSDAFLVKYDSSGNFAWNRVWGGANNEINRRVVETGDGNYAVGGQTASYGTAGDIFLNKFDTSGSIVWSKTWGGAAFDYSYGLTKSNDNGLVIAGATMSYGAGSYDIALIKFNSDGTLAWNRTWGGTGSDSSQSIIRTSDNGFAISGYTTGWGAGNQDMLLLKVKADGTMNNCSSPMCQSPSVTPGSPSITPITPTAPTSSPNATISTPSVTSANATGTITSILVP